MKKIKSPDYFSTQRYIKTLIRHRDNNAPPEAFYPSLKSTMKGLTLRGTSLKNKYIHRSRWNDEGRLFSHIDELKYPPKETVKKKGRLNDIGESVFYSSICELGSIIESQPKFDKLFTIAKIEKIDGQHLIFFPLAIVKPPFNFSPKNKKEKLIFDYLYDEITKTVEHEDEYNSTIAIAHHFFKTEIKSDDLVQKNAGIAYPSAIGKEISNSVTYNLAMSPEVFDNNYKFVEATVYSLSNEQTHYQLNPLNNAQIENDGQLVWDQNFEQMIENATIEFKKNFK